MRRPRRVASNRPSDEDPQRGSESARRRDEAATLRDESATGRDGVDLLRDEVAVVHDTESALRDRPARPSEGADPEPGDGELRDRVGETRDGAAATRDRSADGKDQAANRRDDHAADRDERARDRDQAAEERDREARSAGRSQAIANANASASADATAAWEAAAYERRQSELGRLGAADERMAAGADREASAAERAASASERHDAEQDRDGSATDRAQAAHELDVASHDALTGTYTRGAGIIELARDLSRASRSGEPMTLAFIDVDDLKGVNDRGGHSAGDRLLSQVADALRAHLRPHDVIMRYGGDEFICALTGLTATDAADRLAAINLALAEAAEAGSITVGLAELEAGESLHDLIGRADEDLHDRKRQR
jgi:diguanylate cyclase (GGDEF)-like protein